MTILTLVVKKPKLLTQGHRTIIRSVLTHSLSLLPLTPLQPEAVCLNNSRTNHF